MNPLGFVLPAATIGLGSLLVKPQRGFYSSPEDGADSEPILEPQITIEEMHSDEIVITDHPVERGAQIADHFYKRPAEVVIRCAWSNSPSPDAEHLLLGAAIGVASTVLGPIARVAAAASSTLDALSTIDSLLQGNDVKQIKRIYQKLLALQVSGVTFDIYTGKRAYSNMLFRSLHIHTDRNYENSLMLTAHCRQVLIAQTVVTVNTVNNSALAKPEDSQAVDQGALSTTPADDVPIP